MLELTIIQYILVLISGMIVGSILGLIGGGGSVLAIPLLLYLVGIGNLGYPYENLVRLVVGSSALSVGVISLINSYQYKKLGNLKVKEGLIFAGIGIVGNLLGVYTSNLISSREFLTAFGVFMIITALFMIVRNNKSFTSEGTQNLGRTVVLATSVGFASGFFGIGGGFLIVPALVYSGLCIRKAIGTSLLVIGVFGISTSIGYAINNYVDPLTSLLFIVGGVIGGKIVIKFSSNLSKNLLRNIFAVTLIIVAAYVILKSLLS